MEEPTALRPEFRFHIDRRGRILVENFTPELLELAQVLAPHDPRVAAWIAARPRESQPTDAHPPSQQRSPPPAR